MVFIEKSKNLRRKKMKKLLVSLLTLVLVFAVVASVSAATAPTFSGTLYYEVYGDKTVQGDTNKGDREFVDVRIKMTGSIDEKTDYTVITRYTSKVTGLPKYDEDTGNFVDNTDTAGTGEFQLREGYVTYKSGIGNVSFGQIRVNPSIIDLLDGAFNSGGTMVAPVVLRYNNNISDNTSVALSVIPADYGDYEAGSSDAEFSTKVANLNLGAYVHFLGEGDPGYAANASISFFDALNLYTEYGKYANVDAGTAADKDSEKLTTLYGGTSLTLGKFTFEVEKQFHADTNKQWGAKINYAATKNISITAYHSSNYAIGNIDATNYIKATVTF
jgi:hypothetical protein